ncbi:MAG: ROK family protein [Candidatus Omnitrophota bacterium]
MKIKVTRKDLTYGARIYTIEYSPANQRLDVYPEGGTKQRPAEERKAIGRYIQEEEGIDAVIRYACENGLAKEPRKNRFNYSEWVKETLSRLNMNVENPKKLVPIEKRRFRFIKMTSEIKKMMRDLPRANIVDSKGREHEIPYAAHSSNNAVYVFVDPDEYEMLTDPKRAADPFRLGIIKDLACVLLIHEMGVMLGLVPDRFIDRRYPVNEIDKRYSTLKQNPTTRFEELTLDIVDLNTNLATRDYAAGRKAQAAATGKWHGEKTDGYVTLWSDSARIEVYSVPDLIDRLNNLVSEGILPKGWKFVEQRFPYPIPPSAQFYLQLVNDERVPMSWNEPKEIADALNKHIAQATASAASPYFIGMSMGGTKLYVALYQNVDGKKTVIGTKSIIWKEALGLADKKDVASPAKVSPDTMVEKMAEIIMELLAINDLTPRDLNNIGCTSPGPIDHDSGIIGAGRKTFNLPFENYPFSQKIMSRLGVSNAEVKHDAQSGLEGEIALGRLGDVNNGYYVIQGTGLGGSISKDKKYYTAAPEFTEPGHHIVGSPIPAQEGRYHYRFINKYGKNHPYEVVEMPDPEKSYQITEGRAKELLASGKFIDSDLIWVIRGEKDLEDVVAGVGLEAMLKDKLMLTWQFSYSAKYYARFNEPKDISELALHGTREEREIAKLMIAHIADELGKAMACLIDASNGTEWQIERIVIGSTIGEKLGIDSQGNMLKNDNGDDYYFAEIRYAAEEELIGRFKLPSDFARNISKQILRSNITQDERETAGFDRSQTAMEISSESPLLEREAEAIYKLRAALSRKGMSQTEAEKVVDMYKKEVRPRLLAQDKLDKPELIRAVLRVVTLHVDNNIDPIGLLGIFKNADFSKIKTGVKLGDFLRDTFAASPLTQTIQALPPKPEVDRHARGKSPNDAKTIIALHEQLQKGPFTIDDFVNAYSWVRSNYSELEFDEAAEKYPDSIARIDLNVLISEGLLVRAPAIPGKLRSNAYMVTSKLLELLPEIKAKAQQYEPMALRIAKGLKNLSAKQVHMSDLIKEACYGLLDAIDLATVITQPPFRSIRPGQIYAALNSSVSDLEFFICIDHPLFDGNAEFVRIGRNVQVGGLVKLMNAEQMAAAGLSRIVLKYPRKTLRSHLEKVEGLARARAAFEREQAELKEFRQLAADAARQQEAATTEDAAMATKQINAEVTPQADASVLDLIQVAVAKQDLKRQERFDIVSNVVQDKYPALMPALGHLRPLIDEPNTDTIILAVNKETNSPLERLILRRAFLGESEGLVDNYLETLGHQITAWLKAKDYAKVREQLIDSGRAYLDEASYRDYELKPPKNRDLDGELTVLRNILRDTADGRKFLNSEAYTSINGVVRVRLAMAFGLPMQGVEIKGSDAKTEVLSRIYANPARQDSEYRNVRSAIGDNMNPKEFTVVKITGFNEYLIVDNKNKFASYISDSGPRGEFITSFHIYNPISISVEEEQAVRTGVRSTIAEILEGIMKLVPARWIDGWLGLVNFALALDKAEVTQNIIPDNKSVLIFSEKVTFGERNPDGSYKEAIAPLLPSFIRSNVRVIVVVSHEDEEKAKRQMEFIDEINTSQKLPESRKIECRDSVAKARSVIPNGRYYYFKIASEEPSGLRGVTTINIIVQKILDAIGSILPIPAVELANMHEAARRFAEAA